MNTRQMEEWLTAVENATHATFEGGYLDLENMSDAFMMKVARLFEKAVQPEKAARIILRYVSFTNYIHKGGTVTR